MAKATVTRRKKNGQFKKGGGKVVTTRKKASGSSRAPVRRSRSAAGVITTRKRRGNPTPLLRTPAIRFGLWTMGGVAISTWLSNTEWVRRYAPTNFNPSLLAAGLAFLAAWFLFKGRMRQNMLAFSLGLAAPQVMLWGSDAASRLQNMGGNNGNGEESTQSGIQRRQYKTPPGSPPVSSNAMAAAIQRGYRYPQSVPV